MSGYFQRLITTLAPAWLRGKNGSIFLESQGLILDLAMQRLVEAARAGQPLSCDVSALQSISEQRRLRIYDTEPLASRRYRLSRWLQLHAQRGSHQGEMRNTQPYFMGADGTATLPTIHIVHQDGASSGAVSTWHTLVGGAPGATGLGGYIRTLVDPSNFDFDSNGTNSAKPIAAPWQADTAYLLGQEITNDGGNLYVCIFPGISGNGTPGNTGPSGTGDEIPDGEGTLYWRYARPWSRWWAFIETWNVDLETLAHYDDGSLYDEAGLYYDGISPEIAADLIAMLRDWKASPSALWGVALSSEPIDVEATPTQDADGWWNLPGAGEWGRLTDAITGQATRPPYLTWILDRSQYP